MLTKFEKDMLSTCRTISTLGFENVTKEELYTVITEWRYDLQNMEKDSEPSE